MLPAYILGAMFRLALALGAAAASGQANPASAPAGLNAGGPCRGMAFLASEIGTTTSVSEIDDFARTCRLNLVVIDYAWITFHWPRANKDAIREACGALQKRGVRVAVMYRPRVLWPAEASIRYARDENGRVDQSHNDLCFAHEDSVAWATKWGNRIRSAFPSVDTIILYNLRASCRCANCRGGRGSAHTARFLGRCRAEWTGPGGVVQIGHVGVADEYVDAIDFFCPFLCVNRMSGRPPDFTQTAAQLVRLRTAHPNKPMVPLLKVYWANETHNTSDDIIRAIKTCEATQTGFILWYYDWIFHSSDHRYDSKALVAALGGDWTRIARHFPTGRPAVQEKSTRTRYSSQGEAP